MSWRARLLPASFRGIAFLTPAQTREGGRRLAVHEYPLRETPYTEDLGRSVRTWRLDAILLGAGYDLALRGLHAALEQPDPGILIHPTDGLLSVCVQRYQTTLSSVEGGKATVTIEFVEAGAAGAPFAFVATLDTVLERAGTLYGYVQTGLAAALWVAGVPAMVSDATAGLVGQIWRDLRRVGETVTSSGAAAAAWSRDLGAAERSTVTLSANAPLLAAEVVRQVRAPATLASTAWGGYRALRGLCTWGADLPTVPLTTTARQQQAANQTALLGAVRDCATAQCAAAALTGLASAADANAVARLAAGIPSSAEDLRALKGELLGLIDARAELATDTLYPAWCDLRVALARDLEARALAAPRRLTLIPQQSVPALVLAYRVYGDAGRADEIVRRNRIRHPGLVSGGVAVEVMSD